MNKLEQTLHNAHLQYQRQQGIRVSDSGKPAANSVKFVEPTSEQWIRHHRTMLPCGVNPDAVSAYYRVFCVHDKPLYDVCGMCHRTKKQAKAFKLM